MKIMETLLLCGKQNIAIRGHTPERSNFMAILNSKAQGHPILTEHLANVNSRAKYTTPEIQNDIINIIGNQIRTISANLISYNVDNVILDFRCCVFRPTINVRKMFG
jgi:hypothetical protein